MKIIRIIEIALGVFMLLGVINSIKGIADVGNLAQASGYLITTILFFLIGVFLIYSGIKGLNKLKAI